MKVILLTLLTGMFGLLSPALVHAAAGDLDPSFGANGIVVTEFGAYDTARDAVLQPDGKIVTVGSSTTYSAGSSNSDFALARYNSDGSLDTGFGVGGKTTLDWGRADYASAASLQTDGKIIVAGTSDVYTGSNWDTDYVIVRYSPDGSLDTSFGTAGKVRIDFSDLYSLIGMVVQADGKIILGGTSSSQQYQVNGIVLVRLDTHGNLDTSFGSGGRISTDLGSISSSAAIATRKDGKIVVAATKVGSEAVSTITLLLYNENGSLDTAFGTGGKALTSVSGYIRAVAVQGDGKILVGGGFTTLGAVTEPVLQALGIRSYVLRRSDEIDATLDVVREIGEAVRAASQKSFESVRPMMAAWDEYTDEQIKVSGAVAYEAKTGETAPVVPAARQVD